MNTNSPWSESMLTQEYFEQLREKLFLGDLQDRRTAIVNPDSLAYSGPIKEDRLHGMRIITSDLVGKDKVYLINDRVLNTSLTPELPKFDFEAMYRDASMVIIPGRVLVHIHPRRKAITRARKRRMRMKYRRT